MRVGGRELALIAVFSAHLFGGTAFAARPSTVIAVFPIEDATHKLDPEAVKSLAEYLTAGVGNIPGYSIVPSTEIRERIATQKAETYKVCYDESCQLEIGKEVAASKMVSTRITAFGENACIVNSYIYDLTRAATDATATARASCDPEGLIRAIDQVVKSFRDSILGVTDKAFGSLSVRSTPSGGQIFIDAAPTGMTTPAELPSIAAGAHKVKVETDESLGEAEVKIEAGQPAVVQVPLLQRPCMLSIRTEPPGASVFIGGRSLGFSPVTVEVPPGSVEITAKAGQGYEGKARAMARPSRTPELVTINLAAPLAAGAELEQKSEKGVRWGWVITAAVLTAGGVVLDTVPSYARDGKVEATDFIPIGMYALAAVAAALGIIPAF